jgi:hypothetical protein
MPVLSRHVAAMALTSAEPFPNVEFPRSRRSVEQPIDILEQMFV